jgi:alkaline phosphatase D
MDRRKFLKWGSFITVSAASTTALTACGGGNDDDDDSSAPAAPAGPGDNSNPPPPAGNKLSFAQGVASGDPKPDSMILWTRIEGADGSTPQQVSVQLATDNKFTSLLVDEKVEADPSWDYTVRHKVTNLSPSTTYFYRFIVGGITSTVGQTKTAPAAGATVAQMKFAFISCQDWSANHWAAFDEMLNEDLDFVVHLGDYIYEALPARVQVGLAEATHTPLTLPNGTKMEDGSVYATTVADYRSLYKSYRTDPRLQALHARFPMIAIWDDHEFSDDCWQDRQTYTPTDDQTPQTARRRSANQAWFEFMPADVTLDLTNPSFENIQIYRSFSFGSLATLVMTDERLYRADHIIPESTTAGFIGSRYLVGASTLAAAEAQKISAAGTALTPVSMLGDTQRGWWQTQMQSANTTWKLWGNEVSLLRMQVDGLATVIDLLTQAIIATDPGDLTPIASTIKAAITLDVAAIKTSGTLPGAFTHIHALFDAAFGVAVVNASVAALNAMFPPLSFLDTILFDADQWDGYNAERKALMSFLQTNSIQNVVALTGDIHAFFAGAVMDDYDTTKVPVMVDLVTAGVSSTSLFKFYVDQVNSNPTLHSLAPLVYQNVTNKLNDVMTSNNSWLKYVDTDAQGYSVVTLTPTELTCDFKKMKPLVNGKLPAAPVVASVMTATVAAGTPAVTITSPTPI